jgi:hypothetical protein
VTPHSKGDSKVNSGEHTAMNHSGAAERHLPMPCLGGPSRTPNGGSFVKKLALCVLVTSLFSAFIQASGGTDALYAAQSTTTKPGGTLKADEVWTAAGGPYLVTGTLTVGAGATLTLEPGTSMYLSSGASLVVANGGRIMAEGTDTQVIRFSSPPGSGTSWGGVTINGAVGSPETRLAYASFEGNGLTCIEVAGGTLVLDHATFGTTKHQYVSLDGASFLSAIATSRLLPCRLN